MFYAKSFKHSFSKYIDSNPINQHSLPFKNSFFPNYTTSHILQEKYTVYNNQWSKNFTITCTLHFYYCVSARLSITKRHQMKDVNFVTCQIRLHLILSGRRRELASQSDQWRTHPSSSHWGVAFVHECDVPANWKWRDAWWVSDTDDAFFFSENQISLKFCWNKRWTFLFMEIKVIIY